MGVDAEDVNGDGLPDMFVTNFRNESNTLFINLASGLFEDSTSVLRARRTIACPGSAGDCVLADFDNDGWPDSFVANGHVDDNRQLVGYNTPYAEPPLLHRNIEGQAIRAGDARRRSVLRLRPRRPGRGVRRHRQ